MASIPELTPPEEKPGPRAEDALQEALIVEQPNEQPINQADLQRHREELEQCQHYLHREMTELKASVKKLEISTAKIYDQLQTILVYGGLSGSVQQARPASASSKEPTTRPDHGGTTSASSTRFILSPNSDQRIAHSNVVNNNNTPFIRDCRAPTQRQRVPPQDRPRSRVLYDVTPSKLDVDAGMESSDNCTLLQLRERILRESQIQIKRSVRHSASMNAVWPPTTGTNSQERNGEGQSTINRPRGGVNGNGYEWYY